MKKGYLVLQNGQVFEGFRFGAEIDTVGELVFSTSVVGYVEALTDTLMREAGGDPEIYTDELPQAMAVSEADALAAARRAAIIASGMTEAEFDAYYNAPFVHTASGGVYYIFIYTKTVDTEGGDNHVYQVQVNGETGDVTSIEYTDGVG